MHNIDPFPVYVTEGGDLSSWTPANHIFSSYPVLGTTPLMILVVPFMELNNVSSTLKHGDTFDMCVSSLSCNFEFLSINLHVQLVSAIGDWILNLPTSTFTLLTEIYTFFMITL